MLCVLPPSYYTQKFILASCPGCSSSPAVVLLGDPTVVDGAPNVEAVMTVDLYVGKVLVAQCTPNRRSAGKDQ